MIATQIRAKAQHCGSSACPSRLARSLATGLGRGFGWIPLRALLLHHLYTIPPPRRDLPGADRAPVRRGENRAWTRDDRTLSALGEDPGPSRPLTFRGASGRLRKWTWKVLKASQEP